MVAVVPFRVATADPALHYLREGMLDLLAAKLTGEGGMRATDPRQLLDAWRRAGGSESAEIPRENALALARRLGAGQAAARRRRRHTEPHRADGIAARRPRAATRIAKLSVEGPPDSLAWLVDRLAARLLAETSAKAPSGHKPNKTSLPALRAYLDGQAKMRRVDVVGAAKDFERALEPTPRSRSPRSACAWRRPGTAIRRCSSAGSTSPGANGRG